MAVKRTRFLGIRVTDGEYQQLLERCNGRQLAVWMRETCLDTRPARSLRLPSIDPVLLR
ncbi:plasmid mobilization relaxosome protein MobC, partial [Klebsiella pneumoniae]|nr:plasmid mobilization relaxosome protein MobC [Klebsiella pneumoniae]